MWMAGARERTANLRAAFGRTVGRGLKAPKAPDKLELPTFLTSPTVHLHHQRGLSSYQVYVLTGPGAGGLGGRGGRECRSRRVPAPSAS